MAHLMMRGGVCGLSDGHVGQHLSTAALAAIPSTKRKYHRTPAGRASKAKYEKTPGGKAAQFKYMQTLAGRANARDKNARFTAKRIREDQQYRLDTLITQDGLCALCFKFLPWNDAVSDHDHNCCTSSVLRYRCGNCERGVIHSHCNMALGLFKDRPSILLNAAAYISEWNTANLGMMSDTIDSDGTIRIAAQIL